MATATFVTDGKLGDPDRFREHIMEAVGNHGIIEGFTVKPANRDELAARRSEPGTMPSTIRGRIREANWNDDGEFSVIGINDPIHGWVTVTIDDEVVISLEKR